VLDYIVSALDVPHLAPEAASALKAICDLCRGNLTQHVASFGALHGKVAGMEVSLGAFSGSPLTFRRQNSR
jgi:hypothetical protein